MPDVDEYDAGPSRMGPARRHRRGGPAAVRGAVARLAWTRLPVVHWTGTAPATDDPVLRPLYRRLGGLPAGAYALDVRPAPAVSDADARDAVRLARLAAVAVADPLPVTADRIAAAAAALATATRQPRLLSTLVGDVDAWRSTTDAAVAYAHRVAHAAGDPAVSLIVGSPTVPTARHPLGWPVDVLAAAARTVGPDQLARLARSVPPGETAVVAAVRTRLLVAPATMGELLDALPELIALHARLADEPTRRLRAVATIQGEAVTAALGPATLHGPISLAAVSRPTRRERAFLAVVRTRYQQHVTAAVSRYYAVALPRTDAGNAIQFPVADRSPPVRRRDNALKLLTDLFVARELRSAVLAAEVPADRRRYLRTAAGPDRRPVAVGPDGQVLRYETLAAAAAAAVWADATAGPWPRRPLPLSAVLGPAAVGTVPLAVPWAFVECCCHAWPPGNDGAGAAAGVLLAVAAVRRQTSDVAPVLAALEALAPSLLDQLLMGLRMLGDGHRRYRRERLEAEARMVALSLAAGLTVADLLAFADASAMDVLRLAAATAEVPFAPFARRMRDYLAEWRAADPAEPGRWVTRGHWAATWGQAFADLGPVLLDTLVRDGGRAVGADVAVGVLRRLTGLLVDTDAARRPAQRALLAVALPALLRRLAEATAADRERVAERWYGAVLAADAATAGRPDVDARGLFAHCFGSADAARLAPGFFTYLADRDRCGVAAMANGRADRLLTLARLNGRPDGGVRLPNIDAAHVAAGWTFLAGMSPALAEAVSSAAGRWPLTPRVVAVVARLGLCLRFHRRDDLRAALADVATDELADPVAELARWRAPAGLPGRIREAVERPARLQRELDALSRRPSSSSAAARAEHLRRQLADPDALADWTRRDLAKLLPAATDEARLARLEAVAERAVRGHFRDVLAVDLPPGLTDAGRRNWDNALSLYLSIEKNRGRLRDLLRREAAGDRTSVEAEPRNAAFRSAAAAAGVDVAAWRGPFARRYATPAGPVRVELEADPLHVLQMGNYFGTCLSKGEANAFSTVANATDANKRVAYAYDGRGTVVGRKLLAMTPAGQIVGFNTYGTADLPSAVEDEDSDAGRDRFKALMDGYCRDLARHCRAALHPVGRRDGRWVAEPDTAALTLASEWYNDGAEAFDDLG